MALPQSRATYETYRRLARSLESIGVYSIEASNLTAGTGSERVQVAQMTASERRWTLGCAAFVLGLIAWLNGAATVDWGPLGSALARREAGPSVFAAALALFVVIMLAGIVWTARGANHAYALRLSSSRPAGAPETP